ncbi:nitrogen fixation protein NifZ [Candidatus Frankia alpina]|uniref:Nitrogen fixation protein NifZ n=1 Tax=Candidatus Frankia alpina TaxID=2699483 RepID=A0A4S5ET63_9ACTN|nr:nitrogen fixation protein NifZ [Candidatus Frankia alpina]THJ75270.1 nitrogen fixation protein NifZ [Candidatus Frankia alpina]
MTSNTYDVGDVVMAAKALRNDGTYPDPAISIGEILVEEGTRGQVINVGLYLQEHIVYAIAFENGRIVGALERELTTVEDAAHEESGDAQPAAKTTAAKTTAAGAAAEGSAPAAVLVAEKVPAEPAAHSAHDGAAGPAEKSCKHGSVNCKSTKADAEAAAPAAPAKPTPSAKPTPPAKDGRR